MACGTCHFCLVPRKDSLRGWCIHRSARYDGGYCETVTFDGEQYTDPIDHCPKYQAGGPRIGYGKTGRSGAHLVFGSDEDIRRRRWEYYLSKLPEDKRQAAIERHNNPRTTPDIIQKRKKKRQEAYYQRNRERILARDRERYAKKVQFIKDQYERNKNLTKWIPPQEEAV